VSWRAANGKVSKSVPAALKQHKDAIKSVKALVKEIEADLSVSRNACNACGSMIGVGPPRSGGNATRASAGRRTSRRLIWNVHPATTGSPHGRATA
jgi:hypothetical protein